VTRSPARPRVGFDARAIVFPAEGVRRYARELFSRLPALAPDIDFVAIDSPRGINLSAGTVRGPGAVALPTNLARSALALPVAVAQARLDLFHAPAYTAPLVGRTPVVVTIHDVSYVRRPEFYAHQSGVIRQWFYRRSASRAVHVITDSAFSEQEIVAAYGIPRARITVTPLGVGSPFSPAVADIPVSLPPGVRVPYALHVGDLHARRDLMTALRAVLNVGQRQAPGEPALQLVCAGRDYGAANALRQASTDAGAPDMLVLAGQVSEDALLGLYQRAVALVYPSLYEGFGLPVLEAMACGTPVVAARAGSLPEVVGDGGLLVAGGDWSAMADALAMLLTDADRRQAQRERGLARAADFSWDRTARQTLDVYRSCLGEEAAFNAL
jgi:glycosyltransferase involved in cell wall biosynthesis